MIHTLDYLEKEANLIAGYWNGSDEKFIDGHGEPRSEDDVYYAQDLLAYIEKIKLITKELSI